MSKFIVNLSRIQKLTVSTVGQYISFHNFFSNLRALNKLVVDI